MSTELKRIETSFTPISLTRFFGGAGRGACIQLTQQCDGTWRYIQLSAQDAELIAAELLAWSKNPMKDP